MDISVVVSQQLLGAHEGLDDHAIEQVATCIENLSSTERMVLALHYLEELPAEDIGKILRLLE